MYRATGGKHLRFHFIFSRPKGSTFAKSDELNEAERRLTQLKKDQPKQHPPAHEDEMDEDEDDEDNDDDDDEEDDEIYMQLSFAKLQKSAAKFEQVRQVASYYKFTINVSYFIVVYPFILQQMRVLLLVQAENAAESNFNCM